ncbi:hypothetical protein ACHAW6_004189 [Cyclotella cf. meneghiniana]
MENANKSNLLCSTTISSGCVNPSNINSTALLDTVANIPLLANGAHAKQVAVQLTPKLVMQPKEDRLSTTKNLLLLLNKLPIKAWEAHLARGIANNLISAAPLILMLDVKSFFTKQDVKDPDTCLWHVSLYPEGGNQIVPTDQKIFQQLLFHPSPEINNIYECENTGQLINFYYATMGYPVFSSWIKAIDKGYFQGWRRLTSDCAWRFIKPSNQ